MYNIQVYNKIAKEGLDHFNNGTYNVSSDELETKTAILLRSQKLHDMQMSDDILAIGRAGAGVNNIPVDKSSEKGIVVFNTPGANANAVKELVITAMLLHSRNIYKGIQYCESIKNEDDLSALVEKNKANFVGYELKGKTLGVIGLGAIGMMVANTATNMGMKVIGYDPFISIVNAWNLSSDVERAESLRDILSASDFVTVHMPYTDKTKDFVNVDNLKLFKKNAVLLNFSRAEIVNTSETLQALNDGELGAYITDFPDKELANHSKVLCIPHLGASTEEAEKNCAIMVSQQVKDFLENGNIVNSVNFPTCRLMRNAENRITIINKNVPAIVSKITAIMAEEDVNIVEMMNKSKGELAYNIVDYNLKLSEEAIKKIKTIDGVLKVRVL